MNAATIQLILSALVQVLDLVGRVAEKQFDSREELDAYIEKRNQVREELVSLSLELGGQDEDPGAESPESTAGEPTPAPEPRVVEVPHEDPGGALAAGGTAPAPEQPPSDQQQAEPQQSQSDQEEGDAASPDPSQG